MIFDQDQQAELKKYAYAVYILQALGFVTLITPIIGIIVNYIKDDDVRGSWLESHFRWQKITFWCGAFWFVPVFLTQWIPIIGWILLVVLLIWVFYRIAKGWIYLVDGKEMYQ